MYLLTVSERIKYFLRGRNIPLAEADRLMGNKVGYLKQTKNPGADYIATFCDTFPEVSCEWLIRGSGSMILQEPIIKPTATHVSDYSPENPVERLSKQVEELTAAVASIKEIVAAQERERLALSSAITNLTTLLCATNPELCNTIPENPTL